MRWVSADGKTLRFSEEKSQAAPVGKKTGFAGAITSFAIHELLFRPDAGDPPPLFPAFSAVKAGVQSRNLPPLVWIDPAENFYPPAILGQGISPAQLNVLRPSPEDLTWAAIECLRCRHVGAVVALFMHRPTRVEVRRLQLAAEQGGGIGILLRPNLIHSGSNIYAAATRWLVTPARGERTIQRWNIQQIHGQGRQASFILEKHRATGQTNFVYPSSAMVDHAVLSKTS